MKDKEEIAELVSATVAAVLAPILAQQQAMTEALLANQPKTPDETVLGKAKIQELTSPNPHKKWREIKVRGVNDEELIVHVESDAKTPHGRVSYFVKFTYPDRMYKPQSAGGMVPDGIPVLKTGDHYLEGRVPEYAELSKQVIELRAQLCWVPNRDRFIGQPLRAGDVIEEGPDSGLDTPWIESEDWVKVA